MDKKEQIEHALEFGKKWMLKHGEVITLFHAWNEKGSIVLATPWVDEADKRVLLSAVRLVFAMERITSYLMMSETWQVPTKTPEELEAFYRWRAEQIKIQGDKFSLQTHPLHKEHLVILHVDRSGATIQNYEIKRDKKGNVAHFDSSTMQPDKVSGRMCELLPPQELRLTPKEKAMAVEALAMLSVEIKSLDKNGEEQ